jgi:hypothetical protein
LTFSQLSSQKFDLLRKSCIAVEQDHVLSIESAPPASCAVTRFTQKLFSANFYVERLRAKDEFLQASFLFAFGGSHAGNNNSWLIMNKIVGIVNL